MHILFNPGVLFAELLNQLARLIFSFSLYPRVSVCNRDAQDSKRTVQVNYGQV